MTVRDAIDTIKFRKNVKEFPIKLYEGSDSSRVLYKSVSNMTDELMHRRVKSYCIANDDKKNNISQVIMILE